MSDTLTHMTGAPMLPPAMPALSWIDAPPGFEAVPSTVILPPPPSIEERIGSAMAERFPGVTNSVTVDRLDSGRFDANVFVGYEGGRFFANAVRESREEALHDLAIGLGVSL